MNPLYCPELLLNCDGAKENSIAKYKVRHILCQMVSWYALYRPGAQLGLWQDGCEMMEMGKGATSNSFSMYLILLAKRSSLNKFNWFHYFKSFLSKKSVFLQFQVVKYWFLTLNKPFYFRFGHSEDGCGAPFAKYQRVRTHPSYPHQLRPCLETVLLSNVKLYLKCQAILILSNDNVKQC